MRSLLLLFLSLTSLAPLAAESTAPWVAVGTNGRLVYKSDERGNRIPDFSSCGYAGGGVPLPNLPVMATVKPAEGDAGARIQAAIDAVSKLPPDSRGFRGAVLLLKGRYPIAESIRLPVGGVVLRGEGEGEDGTVLVATGAVQRSLIIAGFRAGSLENPGDEDGASSATSTGPQAKKVQRPITDDYVPVGARRFHVADVAGLKVGDEVVVRRPSTAEWIHTLGMDSIPPRRDGGNVVQWKPGSKDLLFSRVITALAGNQVEVDVPLCNALEKEFGGGFLITGGQAPAISQVGVENLRGDSEFKSPTDEKHGWVLVEFDGLRDAWVRNVTSIHFGYSCVYVHKQCKSVTVEDCTCLDPISRITGGRRYSFALDGQLTLVQRCHAREGRHDFVMHSLAAGPNVFLDCTAENEHADTGPHHRWSVGVLYDNVKVSAPSPGKKGWGEINIRNRGSAGSGHGWAGANQVIWNCTADAITCEQPPTAQNWAIGCITAKHYGDAYWESLGDPVKPRSLYEAQLKERLGSPKR